MKMVLITLLISLVLSACETRPIDLGECPQPRFTGKAPADIYALKNPLDGERAVDAGRQLYQRRISDNRIACASCHGRDGNGIGSLSHMFKPPPRNFTCASTIIGVPDGQLYWIIKNGSPGTSMPSFEELSDDQIWQVVHYIRRLSNGQYDN